MQNEQGIAISSMAAEQWSTEKIPRFPRRDSAIGNRDGMMFESNINFNFAPGFALFSFSGTPLRDDDWDFVEADPLSLISIPSIPSNVCNSDLQTCRGKAFLTTISACTSYVRRNAYDPTVATRAADRGLACATKSRWVGSHPIPSPLSLSLLPIIL
ncbi:unnamed protein product [Musa banksii]